MTQNFYNYKKFPIISVGNGRVRLAYGMNFPENLSDPQIEMWCAGNRHSIEQGGLGEFGHYKALMQILYPYLQDEWHHWLDMQLEILTAPSGTYTMLGGGGIGKSYILGTLFSRIWQACRPTERGVMIINTTQKTQSDRAWKYVIDACNKFPWMPGKLTTGQDGPKLTIYTSIENPHKPGKFLHQIVPGVGIISQTIKRGSSAAATADLKGLHPKELMVVIEESNHLNKLHIERARANWITNEYYKVILTGNPEIEDTAKGEADALYHFSEPLHGYGSINWGVDRTWPNRFGGRAFHFDPYDSPRIKDPERFKVSRWLPTEEYIETKAKELGGTSSLLFKQQIRGIYDHDSLPYNPITLGMCQKAGIQGRAEFTGQGRTRWAAFDPAYSGNDEAFLKIAESGLTIDNKLVIDFIGEETNFSFRINPDSPDEPSFQMMNWVKEKLGVWKVPYENLIMDANIIGIGLGDIFTTFLSRNIHKVKLNGKPSERYIDLAESMKASDVCVNKQTELWIALQQLIMSRQIMGIDDSILSQLIQMPAEKLGQKIKVLEKKHFRARFGYSPDRAETVLFIIDLMREKGFAGAASHSEDLELNHSEYSNAYRLEDIFVKAGPTSYMDTQDIRMVEENATGDPFADLLTLVQQHYGQSLNYGSR